jgi:hypothetical protein
LQRYYDKRSKFLQNDEKITSYATNQQRPLIYGHDLISHPQRFIDSCVADYLNRRDGGYEEGQVMPI